MSEEKAGCEEYLYRGMKCCLHPCLALYCPEPVCAVDFPGGVKAYMRSKELRSILENSSDTRDVAAQMGVTTQTIRRRYNKAKNFQIVGGI